MVSDVNDYKAGYSVSHLQISNSSNIYDSTMSVKVSNRVSYNTSALTNMILCFIQLIYCIIINFLQKYKGTTHSNIVLLLCKLHVHTKIEDKRLIIVTKIIHYTISYYPYLELHVLPFHVHCFWVCSETAFSNNNYYWP